MGRSVFDVRGGASTTETLGSASLGHQVGAAICTEAGNLLATGCNEVPKAHGGLYWSDDEPEERDHERGEDSNGVIKNEILADLRPKSRKGNWLSKEKSRKPLEKLLDEALADTSPTGIKKATLMGITEYGRMVHAEMAALMRAARLGNPGQKSVMFCRTFPCHTWPRRGRGRTSSRGLRWQFASDTSWCRRARARGQRGALYFASFSPKKG
jgi:deoxycytidylate deaminase